MDPPSQLHRDRVGDPSGAALHCLCMVWDSQRSWQEPEGMPGRGTDPALLRLCKSLLESQIAPVTT